MKKNRNGPIEAAAARPSINWLAESVKLAFKLVLDVLSCLMFGLIELPVTSTFIKTRNKIIFALMI